jgi:acetylornithine aminotransferase apoenzyme (EC 2.6.1.11)
LAYQHYNVEPDIFTLAKALGNGFPIGAMAAKEKVATRLFARRPRLHLWRESAGLHSRSSHAGIYAPQRSN